MQLKDNLIKRIIFKNKIKRIGPNIKIKKKPKEDWVERKL